MEIISLPVKDLIPYEKNPRKNDEAVQYVAESIRQFGFKVPIVIDRDNIVVCGHTRLKAAKRLKLKEVPCIIADDLNDEQIKAFRLADNKVSEQAEWDFELLDEEIQDIFSFDMEDFGFEFVDTEEHKEKTQERVENILNLAIASYDGVGKYDIPQLDPIFTEDIGEIREWIGFNYVLSDDEPEGKAVHFFIDDYQFERVFQNPQKYLDKLSKYECVLSPDFSPYGDMPHITQIWNHYRKHWCGKVFQQHGIKVVPTIRCSTDKRSLEWYLDGEPAGGVVAYSSMWIKEGEESYNIAKKEWGGMIEKLKPTKVFLYGKEFDFMKGVNIEHINMFADKWRNG